MSAPQSPPPNEGKSLFWPIAVNLAVLVLLAGFTGVNVGALSIGIAVLAVVNTIAAGIMALSGRMHYVLAFILSGLVLLLVGLGICALLLSGIGGQH